MESGLHYHELHGNQRKHGCLQSLTMLIATAALVGVVLLLSVSPVWHQPGQMELFVKRGALTTNLSDTPITNHIVDARLTNMSSQIDALSQSVKSLQRDHARLKMDLAVWKAVESDRMHNIPSQLNDKISVERFESAMQGIESKLHDKVNAEQFEAAFMQIKEDLVHKVDGKEMQQAMAKLKAQINDRYHHIQKDVQMLVNHSCRACQNISSSGDSCATGACQCGTVCSEWASATSPAGAWSARLPLKETNLFKGSEIVRDSKASEHDAEDNAAFQRNSHHLSETSEIFSQEGRQSDEDAKQYESNTPNNTSRRSKSLQFENHAKKSEGYSSTNGLFCWTHRRRRGGTDCGYVSCDCEHCYDTVGCSCGSYSHRRRGVSEDHCTPPASSACWPLGARVQIIPGSRYSVQDSGCASVSAEICDGAGYETLIFDSDYTNEYEYSDLRMCKDGDIKACSVQVLFECRTR